MVEAKGENPQQSGLISCALINHPDRLHFTSLEVKYDWAETCNTNSFQQALADCSLMQEARVRFSKAPQEIFSSSWLLYR